MKIRAPKFVYKLACRYMSKVIEEETGIRTGICIEELTVDTKGDMYGLHLNVAICADKRDLKRFIKENLKKREP